MKHTSMAGLIEIASHEGIVTSKYRDSVGVWTIGIGHTANAGSPNPASVAGELPIPEIIEIFQRDVEKFEYRVRRAFTRPLTQAQFDAAVSFDFNTGGIHKATWVKMFNAGDVKGARASFMAWRKPPEIIPRREKERDLFFDGRYSSGGYANVYPANSQGRVQWSKGKRVNVARLLHDAQKPAPAPSPAETPKPASPPVSDGKAARNGSIAGLVVTAIGGFVFSISEKGQELWASIANSWPF